MKLESVIKLDIHNNIDNDRQIIKHANVRMIHDRVLSFGETKIENQSTNNVQDILNLLHTKIKFTILTLGDC